MVLTRVSLIVRNIDDDGISAEAEYRNILKQALTHPAKKSFIEVLSEMPDVGNDDDFRHVQETNNRKVLTNVLSRQMTLALSRPTYTAYRVKDH